MANSKTTDKSGQGKETKPTLGGLPTLDDLASLAERFKLPGIDVSAIVESQRKDLEALAEANRTAYEGMQALAQRRAEMLRDSLQRLQEMATPGSGSDLVGKGVENAQRALQQAIENFRELAEIEADHRSKAWAVLQKRFEENMANVHKLVSPQKK